MAVGGFGWFFGSIKDNDKEETPTFGAKPDTDYIWGMTKMKGAVKLLLDNDKVLDAGEVTLLNKNAQGISELKKASEGRRKKNVTPI